MFINIKIEGTFLRRPVSVCDWDGSSVTVIYKTIGKGTEILSRMQKGQKLDVLTGLGNGFDLSLSGERPLLIGGSLGLTPMYALAKALIKEGKNVSVIWASTQQTRSFTWMSLKLWAAMLLSAR